MFTGLIDDVGTIEAVDVAPAGAAAGGGEGRTFRVRCRYGDVEPGESIAVNGVCLTVRECGASWFTVAAVTTTLERTALGSYEAGQRVNLERALRLGDRLGGHIVQGHVDGVGEVRSTGARGDAWLIDVAIPGELTDLVVPLGAIAVDGVSLTVNDLPGPDIVQLSIVDYTLRHTTLGLLRPGSPVHIEADVIATYVRRLAAPYLILTR